jgi:hypothetical protein
VKTASFAWLLAAALALQGCLSSTVLLKVGPRGAGTATLTMRINRAGMQEFSRLLGESNQTEIETLLVEPTSEGLTELFGVPVRLVSTKRQTSNTEIVQTTVLAFDDVTSMYMPFPPMAGDVAGSTVGGFDSPLLIRFAFRPHENGDRLLIVDLPDTPLKPEDSIQKRTSGLKAPENRDFKGAIRRSLKGAAVRLFVELDTPLLRTNAPAQDGNRATILDLDLERMFSEDALDRLLRQPDPLSFQELIWMLGDLPGAILPAQHEVFLEFEAPQPPAPQTTPRPAAPDTEVYVAPLTISADRIEVGTPKNISRSPGYDNQPSFTRDGASILFTSGRGAGQTDIYRYDLSSEGVTQVTNTPESEYSPTETPDGGLSVVRVEADGTQRLWRFTIDGRDPHVILDAVKPVGYHAWADDRTLALFILGTSGANQPSTLRIADAQTGAVREIATDIGRSLARIPGTNKISFVQREHVGEKTTFTITEVDPKSGAVRPLIAAVEGSGDVDCAWTPDGTLLMARGDRLYAWKSPQSSWREVASLEQLGLHGVARLAVSPKGTLLALVANPN